MEKKKVAFNLQPPIGVLAVDHYLGLIDFLVEQLNQYIDVEIVHKETLTNWRISREIESAELMVKTYQQKADLLRKELVPEIE